MFNRLQDEGRSLNEGRRPAGWQQPSWPSLFLVASYAAAFALFGGMWFLAVFGFMAGVMWPIFAAGLAGILYASLRQTATRGALLVAGAAALGQLTGTLLWLFTTADAAVRLDAFLFPSGLMFSLGLAAAPLIISGSQRRARSP